MRSVSFARRAERLSSTLPASAPAGNISFDSGHAFPGVLPDLTAEAAEALTRFRSETLQYAPRTGLPELRKWIADYMNADGAHVTPQNILVTNGAKHGIELICRLLLDEGDSVVVTFPTYFSAIPIIKSFGVRFIEVNQDQEGLDVKQLEGILEQLKRENKPLPKFIYNVPDFHNPTGVTMSLARRKALVDLAVKYNVFLVEDSPYRKVRFEGESIPSLKALDPDNIVFLLGTFSKLMAPGLRVGWVAAAPEFVARMAMLKTDAGSCPLTQRIILQFCSAGRLDEHTKNVQRTYGSNRDHMVAALRRDFPDAQMDIPEGGYYLWLTLPAGVDGDELAKRAGDTGTTLIAGSKFFACPEAGHANNVIRVAFSHANHDEIDEGIRRLAAAYRTMVPESAVLADAIS